MLSAYAFAAAFDEDACSIRQHASAYVCCQHTRSPPLLMKTPAAYVSIRQHTYAVSIRMLSAYVSICQHTSAAAFAEDAYSIREHTLAYVSMSEHTSVYVSIREYT
jgi:hypothetical protein